ncbi:hypothetical protein SEA_LILPHARAOH_41 [Mycobacterium phage LilPharaoh]|uniref:Uncharacterized protein n=1 Tax=Mycobacterium phage Amelie TaxID=1913035 RepID=A0A1J0GPY1_9CAUD|nr:hypothetical protein AVV01_gp43 [Mycobacterium phage Enkosi]YP_009952559.1 hypothetical protein I5G92_gp41 [Mycobacterium phage Amelie]ATN90494.1 hypothetical protein SEA_LILPHARAOH_41 [Mycobacterium phage LilPharaoh]AVP42618.1 hypothetical protein SEA_SGTBEANSPROUT_41 [Mycobacterium phage SgtBeansprout]AXC37147.1 hypothetical protein SEA_BIGLEBOPS_41 [Mycobacterium phage Biglebops]QGJ93326.1 hypothetical protein PBI_MDAVU_42 [Mycobacterium phage Mdavu]UQS94441.1 hypothetical protein SEA_N
MQLARHLAQIGELKRQVAELRGERDAARSVVAAQADTIRDQECTIAGLADQLDQADMAHRAALADLAEVQRQLAQQETATDSHEVDLHVDPDTEPVGGAEK